MQDAAARNTQIDSPGDGPVTLPMTVRQYETLVDAGEFVEKRGQTELIHGRIVHKNPQEPEHADPVDDLAEWSIDQVKRRYLLSDGKPWITHPIHPKR